MMFEYKIVRSERKTVSVSVSSYNEITVHCPRGMTNDRIEKFLSEKSDWIYKKVRNNAIRLSENAEIIELKKIYIGGIAVPLVFGDKNLITKDVVYVKSKDDIKKTFIKNFSESLVNTANKISQITGLKAAGFTVKPYRGKWGCCDSKKHIVLNYLLAMLPNDICEYVIVHELCHTICFNHSHAFWMLVDKYVPNRKILREQLKDYNFLIDLY